MSESRENQNHVTDRPGYPERWYPPKPEVLAEPTYWPAILAGGITFLAWGVVTSSLLSILGLGMTVIAVVNWIGDLRRGQQSATEE